MATSSFKKGESMTIHVCIRTYLLISIITSHMLFGTFSLHTVGSWFGRKAHETTVTHTYIAPEDGTLAIETTAGAITINTRARQEHISLVAVKRAAREEQLPELTIGEEQSSQQLRLKTIFDPHVIKQGSVDYTLTIPENIKIHAVTHDGSITINKTALPVVCSTDNGTISIGSSYKMVHATTKYGSIDIANALHDVCAQTEYGNITIQQAHKNVQARTHKGYITVAYAHIPPTSAVDLHTQIGSINLELPANSNVSIKGSTQRGTITSEHYLTLKEKLTKLDTSAWRRFKKEVDGMLGSGEAMVTLQCASGNVKISQAKQDA
jgi:DUF4097 and DUF4098 domain-containing protein YvlB